jgi:oleate hydratase
MRGATACDKLSLTMKNYNQNSKFYLVGGGIASLASAIFLIRDGKTRGKNITIFEAEPKLGGSLDGAKPPKQKAYFARGFRMFEEKVYSSMLDLFATIPSLRKPHKTLKSEFIEFNQKHKAHSKMRLIRRGKVINARPFGMKPIDRIKLLLLLIRSENSLNNLKIQNYFSPAFFQSNFWLEFATTFSFQPWDSVMEFKRYLLRFLQDAPTLDDPSCIRSTPLNQYDSIVLPIVKWLKKHGVNFQTNCEVTHLDFERIKNKKSVTKITIKKNKKRQSIVVDKNDFALLTIGSIVANSSSGSTHRAPKLNTKKHISWKLWESLAKQDTGFGRPNQFYKNTKKSTWVAFTLTLRDKTFSKLLEKFVKKESNREGIFTIKDSNWVLSMALPHQPHFLDQSKNTSVYWGYGLNANHLGNFVKKKMSECNGNEILTELCHHLGFGKKLPKILKTSACIPCILPYITSQFSPREKSNRPQVIPENSHNFACIGQYCEIPDGIVFTVEHSVQSAQIAVYGLLDLKKKPTRIYKGQYHPKIIYRAIKSVFR